MCHHVFCNRQVVDIRHFSISKTRRDIHIPANLTARGNEERKCAHAISVVDENNELHNTRNHISYAIPVD